MSFIFCNFATQNGINYGYISIQETDSPIAREGDTRHPTAGTGGDSRSRRAS